MKDGTVREYRYATYRPKPIAAPPADTIQALVEAYRRSPEWLRLAEATRATYAIYLKPLERAGHTLVADMRRRDLLTIRDAIAGSRGRGAATGFVRAASALFTWAVAREWLDHSPATKLPPMPGGHLRAWTPAEADRALWCLPEELRRVVLVALYTGQRRGDLAALRWSDYDGTAIRLRQQKTGAALVVPVHPTLKAEMDAWHRKATATTILTDHDGRPWKAANISHRLPYALAKLDGMAGLNIHGLRKLAAANLAAAGCTVHEIASITGHRSLSMVQLYTASADQERLAEAAIVRLQTGTKDKPG